MKKFMKHIAVATAALALAGIASAETLKVDVPFAFNIGKKLMQPGTYLVSVISTSNHDTYKLTNLEQRESAVATAFVAQDPAKEWRADGRPRVAFYCDDSGCTLAQLWNGVTGAPAQRFQFRKSRGESLPLAVIIAHTGKTE